MWKLVSRFIQFKRAVLRLVVLLAVLPTVALAEQTLAISPEQNESKPDLVFLKQNSQPKYFDENDRGLCGEIYQHLSQRLTQLGLRVEIAAPTFPIKRILKMLESGQAHVFCGAGRNAKREAIFDYSEVAIYSVANVVAARENETYVPSGFPDLIESQAIVGALFGTSSAAWLQSHEGVRVNDRFHTLEEALNKLAVMGSNEMQFFYYHDLGLNYLTKKMGLPLKVMPTKFRTTPQWVLYSRTIPLAERLTLDNVLKEMESDGTLATIQAKYLIVD